MDKPDLIDCAVIGDGEAETGPTATYTPAVTEIPTALPTRRPAVRRPF